MKQGKLFLAMNGLAAAKTALINGKVHQVIAVVNLDEVKNWKDMKKSSCWVNVNFEEHSKTQKRKHFAFSFKTNNLNDLLCFSLHLIDSENKEI